MAKAVSNATQWSKWLVLVTLFGSGQVLAAAMDDNFTGSEDTVLVGDLFANDTMAGGAVLVSHTAASSGTLNVDGSGTMSYAPNQHFAGNDGFSYTVRGADPACAGAMPPADCGPETVNVVLDIQAVADPANASAASVAGDEDTNIPLVLSASLIDNDGSEVLSARILDVPPGMALSAGTDAGGGVWNVSVASLGSVALVPNADFNGGVSLRFETTTVDTANNIDTASGVQSFTVNVNPLDDPSTPASPAPELTANEDENLTGSLAGLFDDIDSVPVLSLDSVSGDPVIVPGSVVISGDDITANFEPNANGTVTFSIEATNDTGPTFANIVLTVAPLNDVPVQIGTIAPVNVAEDSGGINVSFSGVFDDVDIATNSDSLSYTHAITGDALFASDTLAGESLSLTLIPNANGTANVRITAEDLAGATEDVDFVIDVASVNDTPTVIGPIGTLNFAEDAPPSVIDLETVFEDVDVATNGQSLNYRVVSVSNPDLFDDLSVSGHVLNIELTPDADGSATVVVEVDDGEFRVTDTFNVEVAFGQDLPVPADDAVTMNEDEPVVIIDVLANDYLADTPTEIVAASVEGDSDSPTTFTYLDPAGDPVTGANGTVTVNAGMIEYRPKANFHGVDSFTYAIRDNKRADESTPGDISANVATVTVTVLPVNDPPTAQLQQTFPMYNTEVLTVGPDESVIRDAYDIEYATLDAGGEPVGGPFRADLLTTPANAASFSFADDGTFNFTPVAGFVGVTTFTYQVADDFGSSGTIHTVRIPVEDPPAAASPPAPGEVATPFDLANTPLEQANGVTPNVLMMMDDSGSMDWNITTEGTSNEGVARLSNADARTSGSNVTRYRYLWTLSDNTYSETSGSGRSMPTEAALDGNARTDNNEYGAWRAWNHQWNVMYYDPEVEYTPWVGFDTLNNPFGNAVATAVRLDPIDPTNTINLLTPLSYESDNVPEWDSDGGTEDLTNLLYLPHYYVASVADVPDFDEFDATASNRGDGMVQICDGATAGCSITQPGNTYEGGDGRTDCAVGDGDPLTCTYAQEMQNFANWFQYYRKREYVAKAAVAAVLEDVNDLRVGYETLNKRAEVDVALMNNLISEGNKKILMDAAFGVNSSSGTPLRDALERAGDLYACDISGRDCPVLPAPDGTCQQNFTLLFSDGYWNGAAGVSGDRDADDAASPWDGGIYADGRADTLADTAMFYYENDLHTDLVDRVVPTSKDRAARVTGTFADGERMHQHMKTFTIAFGIAGSLDPATVPSDPTGTFTWPSPTSSDAAKIDDMLHAAVNGRGEFLSATNPTQLRDAVEDAFDEFSDAQSSTSSASFNSTSLRDGTLLYRGFYDLEDNTGELTATEVDENGVLATVPTWSAADQLNPTIKLPAERRLVTFDATTREGDSFNYADLNAFQQLSLTENQVNWMRGDQSEEDDNGGSLRDRNPDRMLGDIVNSSPVFVGRPRGFNRDQRPFPVTSGNLYSDFVETFKDRDPVVYVGSNDGILHGFDAATGEELFGYVPNEIIDSTARFANEASELTDPFYSHEYYVDLSPRLADVFMRANTVTTTNTWNTVLVGGLGAGGKGFFALNVTNPASAYNTPSNAENVVLWEFTEEDDTYPLESDGTTPLGGSPGAVTDPDGQPVKDLGYSLSLPSVVMSNIVTAGEHEWVALFGNGPNSTSGIAKLFVLNMNGGLNGWGDAGDFYKLSTERGVPITEPAELIGFPNGLGSPTAVDEDLNGTVDLVYAGDRLGNLYRFDLRDSDPDNWEVVLLFTAYYDEGGGVRTRQPILNRPLVVPHPTQDGFLIVVGTGSYVTDEDAGDTSVQSIYGIWDIGSGSTAFSAVDGAKDTRLVEQVITNVVDDGISPPQTRRVHTNNSVAYRSEAPGLPGVYGWYIDLDMPRAANTQSGSANLDTSGNAPPDAQFPGERAIRRFIIRNGNIITTTILPSTGDTSCFGTRPGSILLFSGLTGGSANSPTIDFNNDGVIDENDLVDDNGNLVAAGLLLNQDDLDGSLVDLSTLGGTGDTDFLFVSGGNDTVAYRIEDVNDPRTGRLSWSELQND